MAIERKDGLLTRAEAARYLGVSESWLRQNEDAPSHTKMGRKIIYFKNDLDKYLEERRKWPSIKEAKSIGVTSHKTASASNGQQENQTDVLLSSLKTVLEQIVQKSQNLPSQLSPSTQKKSHTES